MRYLKYHLHVQLQCVLPIFTFSVTTVFFENEDIKNYFFFHNNLMTKPPELILVSNYQI